MEVILVNVAVILCIPIFRGTYVCVCVCVCVCVYVCCNDCSCLYIVQLIWEQSTTYSFMKQEGMASSCAQAYGSQWGGGGGGGGGDSIKGVMKLYVVRSLCLRR